jgi:uncharacterized membrane protein YqaE (UPF0057 family)
MRYILCLLPPIAVLSCTLNPLTIILNIVLTLCLYIPGVIHAILVVNNYNADQRNKKLIDAIKKKG